MYLHKLPARLSRSLLQEKVFYSVTANLSSLFQPRSNGKFTSSEFKHVSQVFNLFPVAILGGGEKNHVRKPATTTTKN